jgi:hypothetical protein
MFLQVEQGLLVKALRVDQQTHLRSKPQITQRREVEVPMVWVFLYQAHQPQVQAVPVYHQPFRVLL